MFANSADGDKEEGINTFNFALIIHVAGLDLNAKSPIT